ncbi:MAG TPA: hypothetical protein VGX48_07805 [Pyrinomonadaceae bacterium]|nr:hypothetical protein [Pyrinomonadaceae bacterium]
MPAQPRSRLLPAFVLALAALSAPHALGQTPAASTATARAALRPGQSLYIVAYRRALIPITNDAGEATGNFREYFDTNLDAERKVRKRMEEWRYFRIAEKPSDADFVFLVNLDDNSIEGLVIPFDAYRTHYKEKYDIDALRDSASGRYIAGPLKLATITRLSDRLVKEFRESVDGRRASR